MRCESAVLSEDLAARRDYPDKAAAAKRIEAAPHRTVVTIIVAALVAERTRVGRQALVASYSAMGYITNPSVCSCFRVADHVS